MFSSAEDPAMVYALAGLASLVAALLAWRAYRQAAEDIAGERMRQSGGETSSASRYRKSTVEEGHR